jgi:methionyl-tRNA formyltransferase
VRTVFFGTPDLAVPSLAAIAEHHPVAAVVCQPDRPQSRSDKPVPPPTKIWASTHGIPVAQPTALNDGAFEAWLRDQAPDLCVLAAYGRILKQPILDVPKHGFLNMHPSLLPRHRGPSPIQTAILCGDEATGVTIMRLDTGMDTGDILLQEHAPIGPDDTTASLSERLAAQGAALLARGVALVESGDALFTPQDHSRASVTRRYEKHDGQIRWSAPAHDIHNLVRAAVPWPVAHCRFKDAVCRIHKTQVLDEETDAPPGTVIRVEDDRLVVAAGRGALAVLSIQMPGKRVLAVEEFLRGRRVDRGERFEDL